MADLEAGSRPPDGNPAAVAVAYLVSAFASPEREHSEQMIGQLHEYLRNAKLVAVFLPGMSIRPELSPQVDNSVDREVSSFVEAVQVCLERQRPETA